MLIHRTHWDSSRHLNSSRKTVNVSRMIYWSCAKQPWAKLIHLMCARKIKNDSLQKVLHSKMNWRPFWNPSDKMCVYDLKRSRKNWNDDWRLSFILQEANFIRCIKPNDLQRSGFFDELVVKTQLQNTGTAYLIENSENVKLR